MTDQDTITTTLGQALEDIAAERIQDADPDVVATLAAFYSGWDAEELRRHCARNWQHLRNQDQAGDADEYWPDLYEALDMYRELQRRIVAAEGADMIDTAQLDDGQRVALAILQAELQGQLIPEATARLIASRWHEGQASHLYAFASTGRMTTSALDMWQEYAEDTDARSPQTPSDRRELSALHDFLEAEQERQFGRVANPDSYIRDGDYNPYRVAPYLMGNEYGILAIAYAEHEQEALDEAVNAGKLQGLALDAEAVREREEEYGGDGVMYLGNAGEPFDSERAWIKRLPNRNPAELAAMDDQTLYDLGY